MTHETQKRIYEEAGRLVERTGWAVRDVINPQIESFRKSYNDYFRDLATASGVIAGAVTALLSSDIPQIEWLSILGFVLLVSVVVKTFLSFKNGLMESIPYIQYLKNLSREMTEFSHSAVKFSRKEITEKEFQEEDSKFKNKYTEWRSDASGERLDSCENRVLSEASRWHSELNCLYLIFLLGIACITLSILIPFFL